MRVRAPGGCGGARRAPPGRVERALRLGAVARRCGRAYARGRHTFRITCHNSFILHLERVTPCASHGVVGVCAAHQTPLIVPPGGWYRLPGPRLSPCAPTYHYVSQLG